MNDDSPDYKFYFQHVPKTGGIAISKWFEFNGIKTHRIPTGDTPISIDIINECGMVYTHNKYQWIDLDISFMEKITTIRNPLDRVISLYNFVIKNDPISLTSPKESPAEVLISRNDFKQYSYFGNTVEGAIKNISEFDVVIDYHNYDLGISKIRKKYKEVDLSIDMKRYNVGNYYCDSFSKSVLLRWTEELIDDFVFYDFVKSNLF